MSERCKRVVNMWAPALDLALIACGALDAMVCRDAALLDVCAGMFLVAESGGHVLGMDRDLEGGDGVGLRAALTVTERPHQHPVPVGGRQLPLPAFGVQCERRCHPPGDLHPVGRRHHVEIRERLDHP